MATVEAHTVGKRAVRILLEWCLVLNMYSVSVCFPFYGIKNLLNMPTGVVPVTHVNQDDLNALSDLDDNELGVQEIKQVTSIIKSIGV